MNVYNNCSGGLCRQLGVACCLLKLRNTSVPFWNSAICWLEMRCCQALAAEEVGERVRKVVTGVLWTKPLPSAGRNTSALPALSFFYFFQSAILFLPPPRPSLSSVLPVPVKKLVNDKAGWVSADVEQPGQPSPDWSALCRIKKSQYC